MGNMRDPVRGYWEWFKKDAKFQLGGVEKLEKDGRLQLAGVMRVGETRRIKLRYCLLQ